MPAIFACRGQQETAWRDWADPAPDEVVDVPNGFTDHAVHEMIDVLRQPLVTLTGGGHMMMLEQPEFVADAIQKWLVEQKW